MSRRLEVGLALVLALAVGVAAWAARRTAGPAPDFDDRASAFLAGPRGSRAAYDVLARLRVPEERRRTALFDLERDVRHRPAVLAVLDPPLNLEAAELAQVVRFVRGGGAVVAAGNGGGIARCVGWRPAYAARFAAPDSFPIEPPVPGLVLPRVANYLKPVGPGGEAGRRMLGAEEDECQTLAVIARDTLLRLRDGRPAALRLRAPAGGSVTLVADVGYFRNRAWRDSDVPQFVVPLLLPARRGRVVWDEYHQEFGQEGSPAGSLVGWLVSSPGGWGLLQLVAVALVGLAGAGVRFGPARAVLTRRRRSPLEHLEALAAGLEGAAGVETSIGLTISGLRRRLGRVGAMAPDAQRAWLAALELALPSAAGRDAVRRLQRVISQPGGPERALAAAQAVEDVWQELRPPQMRARS